MNLRSSRIIHFFAAVAVALLIAGSHRASAEAMLQYFNTEWREITLKMPELAEAGYTSLWLPPPTKGSGGLSVGYDLWDRFDLGSKDQRGTVRTRYGTEADLQELIETAHRFGIRVYFDNITNHNAFDIPGYNADTPLGIYPGFVPEDFHLRITEDGFYRKWDNTRDWNDAWQVQNLGLSDLIDIAHESPNTNFGYNEGDDIPKISFIRQPQDPQYYLDLDLPITVSNSGGSYTVYTFANKEPFQDTGYVDPGSGQRVGAGNGRFDFKDTNGNGQHDSGEISEEFEDTGIDPTVPARRTIAWGFGNGRYDMGNPVVEDVNGLLIRAGRWILDHTRADGFRLDAVKHVPDYFFGQQFGSDKDRSSAGYIGQSQEQFNLTRGFSDWDNHRDSVFNTEQGRDDAMMFGEHLGEPPGYGGYFDAGMRLVDNPLRNNLNGVLGSPGAGLVGYDQPGAGGFAPGLGVTHAQSHDSDYAARRELQHAYYLTREGLPLIYTDGNYHAGVLGGSGGAFPRHSNTNFLGQFADPRIPNLLQIHNAFARGYQVGRWSDSDLIAYERMDKREDGGMSDADGVTALVLMNDNYADGQRPFDRFGLKTAFPPGAYLYQYAIGPASGGDNMTGFYVTTQDAGGGMSFLPDSVIVPRGGYYVFSWRSPEESEGWSSAGGSPVTILQSGQPVGTMTYERKDGPDGDPNYNPKGVPGDAPGDFKYSWTVPRITSGANLSFIARSDASAENILLQLDGGVDINSHLGLGPTGTNQDKRDHAPAVSTDTFLGYEQAQFVARQYGEKFAAINTNRNKFGSAGAETYRTTIGSGTVTVVNGSGPNDFSTDGGSVASFFYHDPAVNVGGISNPPRQYSESANGITIWAKPNSVGLGYRAWIYYTTDGSNPEGAGGVGTGTTKTVALAYQHSEGAPNAGDWWRGAITPKPAGQLRYKISIYKDTTDSVAPLGSIFPSGPSEVTRKRRGMTTFQVSNFNAAAAQVFLHNDYGERATGLAEGFHVLRARAFLNRGGRASIYNTFTQTFYYDTRTPEGEIKFPTSNGETVGGPQYGVVVRADPSVTEVWYHIDDGDLSNDDAVTGTQGGNGSGPEPYVDANRNGTRDANEPFTDLNGNGAFDSSLSAAWTKASEVTPGLGTGSTYSREWRFNYRNIPANGTATIKVRLLEISSSRNMTLAAPAAHVTELSRSVQTAGPDTRLFVAYPQMDGQTVGQGYLMKVRFSASLADGTSEQQLRDRFSVKIASKESGSAAGAVLQPTQNLPILYNVVPGFHDFQFALPNLYNGIPDFLHTIEVTMIRPGNSPLVTTRQVRAEVSQPTTFVNVINPPEFDSDGRRFEIVLPDLTNPTAEQRQYTIEVETGQEAQAVGISFTNGAGVAALINDGTANPRMDGKQKFWRFKWTGMTAGEFSFSANVDTDGNPATTEARSIRNATVVIRQVVSGNDSDADDDDDGLPDASETASVPLPGGDPNSWTNAQVHEHFAYGLTHPLRPDSDGDGLPDGLELGWQSPGTATNVATDTNGDGFPNFAGDIDPPVYNTNDNSTRPAGYEAYSSWPYNLNRARTDLIAGTVTNPNKPDSDDDGLRDGVEDFNRNGRVEIGIVATNGAVSGLVGHPATVYNSSRIDGAKLPAGAEFLETDPNAQDTDGDFSPDGAEDANRNGRVDLVLVDLDATANGSFVVLGPLDDSDGLGFGRFRDFTFTSGAYVSNRISKAKLAAAFPKTNSATGHKIGVLWKETDPCSRDTDGDGLPDGWEIAHGLDPLDSGITGQNSLRTGKPADILQGAGGDPDADGITNALEYTNGTDPRSPNTGTPPPANSIVIGPQAPVVVGGVINAREFTDWTVDDLIALDEYEGDGFNSQGGDVFMAYDGFDSSRDLVAFYAHDGGDSAQGGDGNFYFRVDLHDLRPFAEDGNLDIYVVVDTGNNAVGEYALPDEVDTGTEMRWEAVVACYSGNNGRVYVDTNHSLSTTQIGQDLGSTGVVARSQNVANGFKKAYYNSDLDAVEFSISRQALLDAGWDGLNASQLNFQVFTTKDGTNNNPRGGGDIGGRSDIRDTIADDYLADDAYEAQAGISGSNSVLRNWIGKSAANDRGKRAKIISLVHGNQAIQPGSTIQSLVNTGTGAGYYRTLDSHEAYGVPLSLHITPTLASAIEWAKVDANSPHQDRDGPALNSRIRQLAAAGTIDLLGSTFSDHSVSYFTDSYNASNVALASEFLSEIYGANQSPRVLWNPERIANGETLTRIGGLGFEYTFGDQMRHVLKWFGRQSALSNDGYRLNRVNGVQLFVINDQASTYRFQNMDRGLPGPLRDLLGRKARSGTQDQVVILVSQWEDFTSKAQADAYDRNIRWLASRPWVQVVTPDQIAEGNVDLSQPPDGKGDPWGSVDRGENLTLARVAHDFLDHATQENYDNWYNGQPGREESLKDKRFEIRPGTALSVGREFGVLTAGTGIVSQTWSNISGMLSSISPLAKLARGTAFAASFQTAFHNQANDNLSKYSTGAYIYPDTNFETLATFAKAAQSQLRFAAQYKRVETWAAAADAGTYAVTSHSEQADVDLDGENELLLYNDRVFAILERLGGRLTAAWVRDIESGKIFQAVGNPLSYAGSETEAEGTVSIVNGTVGAYRISAFRDHFLQTGGSGAGTTQYVNDLYNATLVTGEAAGVRLVSSDGKITKTITLSPRSTVLSAVYQIPDTSTLFVRFGLSPNLMDLLLHGQTNLTAAVQSGPAASTFNVTNRGDGTTVRTFVRTTPAAGMLNLSANDRDSSVHFDTIPMRNLAQIQQVEASGGNGLTIDLGLQTGATNIQDTDGDGLPDWWEKLQGLDPNSATGADGAGGNPDGDGKNNLQEFLLGSNPKAVDFVYPQAEVGRQPSGARTLRFDTRADREYRIYFTSDLSKPWTPISYDVAGTGQPVTWVDDSSETAPDAVQLFYRVEVRMPQTE